MSMICWRCRLRLRLNLIYAAGGKLRTDLMTMIELRHLIVDGAQQFLADNI